MFHFPLAFSGFAAAFLKASRSAKKGCAQSDERPDMFGAEQSEDNELRRCRDGNIRRSFDETSKAF